MEKGAIDNKALEEFRKRLERWDELCAQLRELYYRYLDLAAFRSDKCYFPGRRCERPWGRKYDIGDLTLMWTYIVSTAPLCGRLMRVLTEVEYKVRVKTLESFEKYSGVKKITKGSKGSEIVHIYLRRQIYAYLVLWNNRVYVIWGEFGGLPRSGRQRFAEIEYRIVDLMRRLEKGEDVNTPVEVYEIDDEYKRLWFELPLPKSASRLLGEKDRAPVALFRNLGWLLSDDSREQVTHGAGNPGQISVRLFDWLALAKYVTRVAQEAETENVPLIFRIAVHKVSVTKRGVNPQIQVTPVGKTAEMLFTAYKHFGITLGETENVLARGYTILRALREVAFKRNGKVYVVDDVGAWIAFSNAVTTLVLGDGSVLPYGFRIAVKTSPGAMMVSKLASALGGTRVKNEVFLHSWNVRLMLPISPEPAFAKAMKLYKVLVNYPVAVEVKIDGVAYLLYYAGGAEFGIGKKKGKKVLEVTSALGIRIRTSGYRILLTYKQLRELEKLGIPVKFLNDMEKEDVKKEALKIERPKLELVKVALERVAKIARIRVAKRRGREYIKIIPNDKSKCEEIATILRSAGIKTSLLRRAKEIRVYEHASVEAILAVISDIFPSI